MLVCGNGLLALRRSLRRDRRSGLCSRRSLLHLIQLVARRAAIAHGDGLLRALRRAQTAARARAKHLMRLLERALDGVELALAGAKRAADAGALVDYRVLALLFCFMAVVAGFRSVGLFEWLIKKMLYYVKNARQLELVLVLGCFFASMWITNDVALLTFVPFAVAVLQAAGLTENLIFVIVMQTIAANLGSMCTPIGNPQNLYLYSLSGSPVTAFLKLMFPVTAVSLGLLLVTSLCIPKREIKVQAERAILEQGAADRKAAGRAISDRKMSGAEVSDKEEMVRENAKDEKVRLCGYLTLFFLCILTVLHVLDYRMLLAIVIGVLFVLDRQLFTKPDYMLLITFVAFFILVGNIKNMDGFSAFLRTHVGGHELAASIFASQIISNVPAAVLLSGFTENINALILGTNIGGLGTLIASMASLISYKQYALTPQSEKGKYMLVFTGWNVVFLVILWIVAAVFY